MQEEGVVGGRHGEVLPSVRVARHGRDRVSGRRDEQRRGHPRIRDRREVDPGVPEADRGRGVQVREDAAAGVRQRRGERGRRCVLHADEIQPVAVGWPRRVGVRGQLTHAEPALVVPQRRPLRVRESAPPLPRSRVEVREVAGRQDDALVMAAADAVPEPRRCQRVPRGEEGVVRDPDLVEERPQCLVVRFLPVCGDQEQLQVPRSHGLRSGSGPSKSSCGCSAQRRRVGAAALDEVGRRVLRLEG